MNERNLGILTNEQAHYLLKLPKKMVHEKEVLDDFIMNQVFPFRKRFELVSPDDDEFVFLWEINQSAKDIVRISLHVQDNDSKIGLFRVDFNSGHKNPETKTDSLPERFYPYVGKEFTKDEHHVHYHVEGYKSLAWAIPIINDEFEIKSIEDDKNINYNLINVITLFAKTINIETKISINPLLL